MKGSKYLSFYQSAFQYPSSQLPVVILPSAAILLQEAGVLGLAHPLVMRYTGCGLSALYARGRESLPVVMWLKVENNSYLIDFMTR